MINTKTAKSNQTRGSNHATTPKRRGAARKKAGAVSLEKRSTRRKTAEPSRPPRKDSKQQLCLNLLCRAEGASIEDLQKVTGWQAHTVRGFLSRAVKRKLGLELVSHKSEPEPRRYRIRQPAA
jgi:Protein of unknown function (DUF3489)